jgi:hypothetical protein
MATEADRLTLEIKTETGEVMKEYGGNFRMRMR